MAPEWVPGIWTLDLTSVEQVFYPLRYFPNPSHSFWFRYVLAKLLTKLMLGNSTSHLHRLPAHIYSYELGYNYTDLLTELQMRGRTALTHFQTLRDQVTSVLRHDNATMVMCICFENSWGSVVKTCTAFAEGSSQAVLKYLYIQP